MCLASELCLAVAEVCPHTVTLRYINSLSPATLPLYLMLGSHRYTASQVQTESLSSQTELCSIMSFVKHHTERTEPEL